MMMMMMMRIMIMIMQAQIGRVLNFLISNRETSSLSYRPFEPGAAIDVPQFQISEKVKWGTGKSIYL